MSKYWYEEGQEFGSIPLAKLATTQGLDLCKEMLAGKLPAPTMAKALNFHMCEAEEGRVVFKGTPLDEHYNPAGVVHGGWAGAILDSALGCCVWTKVPLGMAYTTAEFKVHLVRPMTDKTGEVFAEARVVHMGRKLATSEGTLKTADGKLLAHGTETCAIFNPLEG
ncbi:MAG: PaaI family thioesterase, partial [Pseudomonadota bacterium]